MKALPFADQQKYEGWSWAHLKQAFIELKLLVPDAPNSHFAQFMAQVFGRNEGTIARTMYRTNRSTMQTIVAKVVAEFRPVRNLIDSTR